MSGLIDGVAGLFYRFAASGFLPAAWFRKVDPAKVDKSRRTGKLSLEIVCHCWQYGHFLTYQLSSLVKHHTDKLDITMSVFYADGDVARACGYCEDIGLYQKPSERWRKTFEDRAFRWIIGSQGTAVDVPGACQIRHVSKGRYKQDSFMSKVRMSIRKSQE